MASWDTNRDRKQARKQARNQDKVKMNRVDFFYDRTHVYLLPHNLSLFMRKREIEIEDTFLSLSFKDRWIRETKEMTLSWKTKERVLLTWVNCEKNLQRQKSILSVGLTCLATERHPEANVKNWKKSEFEWQKRKTRSQKERREKWLYCLHHNESWKEKRDLFWSVTSQETQGVHLLTRSISRESQRRKWWKQTAKREEMCEWNSKWHLLLQNTQDPPLQSQETCMMYTGSCHFLLFPF